MGFHRKRILHFILISFLILPMLPEKAFAQQLSIHSGSAIVMDQKTGRVFYGKNIHEKRRIASITKIMTAIIAIESGKMNDLVTVGENAPNTEGSSVYLKPGEKIKLEDLVYGLMLRSGNDAAVAIAEYVGGSLEGFVYLMNEKAALIGMTNTRFANPHGLDDHEHHFSTAYDMALLTKYAMENKKYREISGTKVYFAPNEGSQWKRQWTNKNRLLTELYPHSTGGKTGYTKRAKRTLVSTAAKDNMELIAVTLNTQSQTDWDEHIQMFEHVFQNYQYVPVVHKGKISAVKDPFYKNKVYLEREYVYPLTAEEKEDVSVKYRLMKPEKQWRQKGGGIPEIVGKTEIYIKNQLIHTLPIYFHQDEKQLSVFYDAKRIFRKLIGVKSND